jgi:hypothetical protein
MEHLDKELRVLDDIVTRVQEQNDTAHKIRAESLAELASGVQSSYSKIEMKFSDGFGRANQATEDVDSALSSMTEKWGPNVFQGPILDELSSLRHQVESDNFEDYTPTGQTPAKTKNYPYQITIPRTEDRAVLLHRMHNGTTIIQEEDPDDVLLALNTEDTAQSRSPSKGLVFADKPTSLNKTRPDSVAFPNGTHITSTGLRELDLNTLNNTSILMGPPASTDPLAKLTSSMAGGLHTLPPLKRINTTGNQERKMATASAKGKRGGLRSTVAGKEVLAERENLTMPNLSASVGAGSVHPGTGRRLRSRDRV